MIDWHCIVRKVFPGPINYLGGVGNTINYKTDLNYQLHLWFPKPGFIWTDWHYSCFKRRFAENPPVPHSSAGRPTVCLVCAGLNCSPAREQPRCLFCLVGSDKSVHRAGAGTGWKEQESGGASLLRSVLCLTHWAQLFCCSYCILKIAAQEREMSNRKPTLNT